VDFRPLRLELRKAKLAELLRRLSGGIELSKYIEADGATVFRHACKLGCEGIVSKQRDAPYRSGRVRTWIKIKNPSSPAMNESVAALKQRQTGAFEMLLCGSMCKRSVAMIKRSGWTSRRSMEGPRIGRSPWAACWDGRFAARDRRGLVARAIAIGREEGLRIAAKPRRRRATGKDSSPPESH
jgi:hypothetical protein